MSSRNRRSCKVFGPAVTSGIVRIMSIKRRIVPRSACGVSTVSRDTCFTRVALPTIDVVKICGLRLVRNLSCVPPSCCSVPKYARPTVLASNPIVVLATSPTQDLAYFLDMNSCHHL
ncbi:unnamed protein product [Ectocarpus sp. 13 AM-2016]